MGEILEPELTAAIMIGIRYLVCLFAPLVPATLIFKLFPDSKLTLSGPLQGLSVKSGGAFAAYLITFLIALPMTSGISDLRNRLLTPVWEVEAEIMIMDSNTKELELNEFADEIVATFRPKSYNIGTNKIYLYVPVSAGTSDFPAVLLEIPGFGGETFDLDGDRNYEVDRDESQKKITVKDPIVIREQRQ